MVEKEKVVFTNGCFDLLHVGHIRCLQQARKLGSKLVVGLNSDESIKRVKGKKRPIVSENNRLEVLLALSCVDKVYLFNEDTPLNLILKVHPDILVKGGDYKISDIVGAKEVLSWGGEVKTLNFHKGFSSTDVIKKLKA